MAKNDPVPSRVQTPARHDSDPKTSGDAEIAALQTRLLDAQATIASDYTRLRELEARYRHLFDCAAAQLVVDGRSMRVLDANPNAGSAFAATASDLVGRALRDLFEPPSAERVVALATDVAAGAHGSRLRVETAHGQRVGVTAHPFRQDGALVLVVHVDVGDGARPDRDSVLPRGNAAEWSRYAAASPDAQVLTDGSGRIREANGAFVELVHVATDRQLRGESLGRWLGRTSVDLGVLVTNLRQRGSLKLFSTSLRGEYGGQTEVEISAALLEGDETLLGFTLRDVGRRLAGNTHARGDLSKSVAQLSELVGRMPMKEIVGNTASLIEKMCIEAALELTRSNRAAAAELLGLSRQSLYVKLRRYGMAEGEPDEDARPPR